jgi:hypothetical protein
MTAADPCRVVNLLDAAGDTAWECRGRDRAILTALAVLRKGPAGESAAALAAWCRAVDFAGQPSELAEFLAGRYRDRGDIALSLKRAAVLTEQAARETRTSA